MKPNKLHEELCDCAIILTKIWKYTNDINSSKHYKNNSEHIKQFVIENKISKEDAEQLTNALDELYHTIKTIGLLNNKD